MTIKIRVLAMAVLFGAFSMGLIAGKPHDVGAVTYQYDVWNQPGGSSNLGCGWHTVCSGSSNNGTALDWSGFAYVYWRSYSANNQGAGVAGQGLVQYVPQGQCYFTYVDIWDNLGVYRGEIGYQHVYSGYGGYRFNILSGFYPPWTEFYFGYTGSEPSSCETTGLHVHQYLTSGPWSKNTIYPTMAGCSSSCGTYDFTLPANYQFKQTWYQ